MQPFWHGVGSSSHKNSYANGDNNANKSRRERTLSGATLLELTGVSWAGLERLTALDYLLSHMAWEGTCPFPGSTISDLEGTSPFRGHSEVKVGPLVRDWRERALSGDRSPSKAENCAGPRLLELGGTCPFPGSLRTLRWRVHRARSPILRHGTCWCLGPLLLSDSQGCSQATWEIEITWGTSTQSLEGTEPRPGPNHPFKLPWAERPLA